MFKTIKKDAILPLAQTEFSAGYDVYANEDVVIGAGETKIIGTGIALDVPIEAVGELAKQTGTNVDFYVGIYLRSSLGAKGLILPNGVGVIDIDYKDEIKMIMHNTNAYNGVYVTEQGDVVLEDEATTHNDGLDVAYQIKKGDRIGQLIMHKHEGFLLLGDKFRKNAQRVGGLGSTGADDVE